ncbi:MAG: flagellar filament capping protein FliD [Pontibacterium sp.]
MSSEIISALGAGSGIDVSSLASSLVEAQRAPTDSRLNTRQEKLETQISAYGQLSSALSEFQDVLSPLADPDLFTARAVSFPDTDIITPNSIDPDAQIGSYQVEVTQVAQSHSLATGAIEDDAAALGEGDITIRFGAWDSYTEGGGPVGFTQNADLDSLTISLDSDDSLNDLADKINDAEAGIQASVLQVDGQYQLLLTADTGESHAMEITATGALSQFSFAEGDANLTQTQTAADAHLKMNGLEITRSSNDVDDVVDGLSFTINKAAEGESINISIAADKDTAETAVRDFVEAYNLLYETMDSLISSDATETEELAGGSLATDGSARALVSNLRNMLTGSVAGVAGEFDSLTLVGIRTQIDGTLEINEDDFTAAFEDNFEEISGLFARQGSVDNAYIEVGYGTYVAEATSGQYDIEITTEPAKGYLNGDAPTAGFPLDTGTGDAYSFNITVDGSESATITLPNDKTYADEDELAADLQSLINGDETIKGDLVGVDVAYNSTDGRFEITSRTYGDTSTVEFSSASTAFETLGLSTSSTSVAGVDVAGTIDGVAGFGSGNVLLPDVDSDPYGLNFTIEPGALGSSTLNFSHGLAGELSLLIDDMLSSSGTITAREDSLNDQLEDIEVTREKLDERMASLETRLLSQFSAMEAIISSFSTTSNSLDSILDTLPFTASSN